MRVVERLNHIADYYVFISAVVMIVVLIYSHVALFSNFSLLLW